MRTPQDWALNRLHDIVDTCEELARFVGDKTVDAYLADRGLQRITERLLEIVGEATGQAIKHDPLLSERIPHAREVIGMRIWLIHGYPDIRSPDGLGSRDTPRSALSTAIHALIDEREGNILDHTVVEDDGYPLLSGRNIAPSFSGLASCHARERAQGAPSQSI